MSLINEMLRDLEKRRKREERCLPPHETPVVVSENNPSKFFWRAGWVLLLAGLVWVGVKIIPGMQLTKPAILPLPVAHEVITKEDVAAVIPEVAVKDVSEVLPPSTVSAPVPDTTSVVMEKLAAELLSLGVVEDRDSVQLSLTFAQLPEYRLLQNDAGTARLVVSFSQTQLGADFEIPKLTGGLLKQVSLVPQQQTLKLLAELDNRAQVQSFQFIDNSDQGHRLLIEIVAAAAVVEKVAKPAETSEPSVVIPAKVVVREEPVPATVSKNHNPLSRDQQAHQAGLEHLRQGRLGAAEASFNQAIEINPNLLDARLQLIELLQQQMKLTAAEDILQQGLSLAPGNRNLRKIYARLLLNNQRQGEAIELLKTAPLPVIAQDLEYYALLAALYQESGQFEAASAIYAQLLKIKPQAALWWMGMAISLEQSGSFEPARNAFQKALNLPGLRPDLQNYIQGRLQAL